MDECHPRCLSPDKCRLHADPSCDLLAGVFSRRGIITTKTTECLETSASCQNMCRPPSCRPRSVRRQMAPIEDNADSAVRRGLEESLMKRACLSKPIGRAWSSVKGGGLAAHWGLWEIGKASSAADEPAAALMNGQTEPAASISVCLRTSEASKLASWPNLVIMDADRTRAISPTAAKP